MRPCTVPSEIDASRTRAGSAARSDALSDRHSTATANRGCAADIAAAILETLRIWRESTGTVNKRIRRLSRLPLMIVLLINTAVTGTGWAMNAPAKTPEQPVVEHVHCGEAMEQMAG